MKALVPYSSSDDSSSPQNLKNNSHHFKNNKRLLETGLFADQYFLSNDGRRFSVHRAIVAQSRVFENMFSHSDGNEVTFDELDGDELESLLKYIYIARTPPKKHRSKLLIAGDKYVISGLVDACAAKVLEKGTPSEAIQLLIDAFFIDSNDLKEKALQFVDENYDSVRKSEDFNLLEARHFEGLYEYRRNRKNP